MKKILFIIHDDLSGGSSKSLLSQIFFLKKEKFIDPVVVTWKNNSLSAYLREMGVSCYSVRFDFTSVWTRNRIFHLVKRPYYRLCYNFFAYKKLKKEIDFSEISLIVSNSSVIDLGAYLHKKTYIPHVWYLREFGDLDFNILPYIRNFPNYINSFSDGIIAVSKAVAEHWQKRGVKKSIEVIYNGVIDKPLLDPVRKRLSIVNICMCGRLCPAKGQALAIKALQLLPKMILENIRLDFFGQGESEKLLKSLVKNGKLDKYVSFNGFSDDLNTKLYNYEIGLTLSKAEAFGRTTVEYLSHSLFVIASNSGGTPEILEKGKYGILVDFNSPEQLAKAIEYYCENRDACVEKTKHFRVYAENFSVAKSAKHAYDFYKRFMNE